MNIKKGKKGRDKYDPAVKRKVCEELLTGRITVNELRIKYQIPGNGTVYRWLKRYQEEQAELVSLSPMTNSPELNDNGEKSN